MKHVICVGIAGVKTGLATQVAIIHPGHSGGVQNERALVRELHGHPQAAQRGDL